MSDPQEPDRPGPGNQLMREASLWFARMRGPDAEASRPEFDAWLARGAMHRRAYNRAAEIFAMGKVLDDEPSEIEHPQLTDPDRRKWPLVAVALGLFAILIAGFVVLSGLTNMFVAPDRGDHRQDPPSRRSNQFATTAGETRTIRLADGSSVTLSPQSRLVADIGETWRDIRLERGRARFVVAHDARPFVVQAGGGSVTARGTVFEVAIGSDRLVRVSLISGEVDVSLPARRSDPASSEVRRLAAGEALSFMAPGIAPPSRPVTTPNEPPPPRPAGHGTSSHDYRDVRIADIVAEANRYASVRIRLADSATGEQRISGHFRIDDTGRLADRLAVLFDLAVDRTNPHEIVLRPR